MQFRQLECFLAVAEELHFGRAARRLHMTQPPLSLRIRRLEEELGVRLFDRSSRRVALTAAGESLVREARAILDRIGSAAEITRAVARGDLGILRLGFVGMAMDATLPRAIRDFLQSHPGVQLSLDELSTLEQLKAVRGGRLDGGLVRLYEHDLTGLSSERVMRVPYRLAIPHSHPLTRRRRIPLRCLKGVPMITHPRRFQPHLYDRISAACRQEGFEPHVVQEAVTKRTTLALVAAGIGVALVPSLPDALLPQRVVTRPIAGDLPMVEISVVWPEGRPSMLMGCFLETAHRYRVMAKTGEEAR